MSTKTPFKSSVLLSSVNRSQDPSPSITLRASDVSTHTSSHSSFRTAAPGSPLVSTQQIPLDWSRFENHTFFNSAEASTNVAFDTIINGFPFDGKQSEIYEFLDGLTGYEKYVYDAFPKSLNSLYFSGSYISVIDSAGGSYPDISRRKDGSRVLDPGKLPLVLQFKAYFEPGSTGAQAIVQKLSGSIGYTLYVSSSNSTTANVVFAVTSGSSVMQISSSYDKGSWVDVAAKFNRRPAYNILTLYKDGVAVKSSSNSIEMSLFDTPGSSFLIGSGTSHSVGELLFTPVSTFSGSLDEFKVLVGDVVQSDIDRHVTSSAYPEDRLRLYFKFNEPSGSYTRSNFVIDSSGNGLHAQITGFVDGHRSAPRGTPSFKERREENPVLFPNYSSLISLNTNLLSSASEYDSINPNLITKLVPKHYFEEGQFFEGLADEDGTIGDSYPADGNLPRYAKLGTAQVLSSLLYVWAKQFDETKVFLDHFSKLESYDIVSTGSIADQFLQFQARNIGYELPSLFSTTSPKSSFFGDDLGISSTVGKASLAQLQATVWRRIVSQLPEISRSKGTVHSIKSMIRAFGIDPDVSLRVREYGGPTEVPISGRIERKLVRGRLFVTGNYSILSPNLSGSRTELGSPLPAGSVSAAGSTNASDGQFTSGSWMWEGVFRYPTSRTHYVTESLVRFYVTGSSGKSLVLNVTAQKSGSLTTPASTLTLHGGTSMGTSNPFTASLGGCSVFDGDWWNVSIGRQRLSHSSSNYFLRAGKMTPAGPSRLVESTVVVTSSGPDVLSVMTASFNASGSHFEIGGRYVNESGQFVSLTGAGATGSFSAEVAAVRMFSKYMTGSEWATHVGDIESLGVSDPTKNFGFSPTVSGSFERLRLDVPFDQMTTSSDSTGALTFVDYSQAGMSLTGIGFVPLTDVIRLDEFRVSSLNPRFDERSIDNRVRVLGWSEQRNIDEFGGSVTPAYSPPAYERFNPDNRFGVEISTVQALDADMMRIFGDYSELDIALGSVSSMFEDSYVELGRLRDVYFNRLTTSVDYYSVLLFSRWFESNIESLVEQLVPSNVKFVGTNMVHESHVLERHKQRYEWGDLYLGENDRMSLHGALLLAELTGDIKRF